MAAEAMDMCRDLLTGTQTFRPQDAPNYRPAQITILVRQFLCVIDLAFIIWWFRRHNRKKIAQRAQPGYVKLEN